MGEDPRRSPLAVLQGTQYPAERSHLIQIAEESEASVDVINVIKSLPRDRYASEVELMRDLGEASRRFGMSNFRADEDGAIRDRRDIAKEAVEGAPEGFTKHP